MQGLKAIFTSPSSANEVDGEGDGADIIENNRRTRRRTDQAKVKTCVASIIGMRKVTPRAIAYAACQVRFIYTSLLIVTLNKIYRFDLHFPISRPGAQ